MSIIDLETVLSMTRISLQSNQWQGTVAHPVKYQQQIVSTKGTLTDPEVLLDSVIGWAIIYVFLFGAALLLFEPSIWCLAFISFCLLLLLGCTHLKLCIGWAVAAVVACRP